MEKNDRCPCFDCILIPVCRHKHYFKLTRDCELVSKYLTGPCYKTLPVENVLEPTEWFVSDIHDMPTVRDRKSGRMLA